MIRGSSFLRQRKEVRDSLRLPTDFWVGDFASLPWGSAEWSLHFTKQWSIHNNGLPSVLQECQTHQSWAINFNKMHWCLSLHDVLSSILASIRPSVFLPKTLWTKPKRQKGKSLKPVAWLKLWSLGIKRRHSVFAESGAVVHPFCQRIILA